MFINFKKMEKVHQFYEDKSKKLFIILGAFFVTNAVIAELIGVKVFSLEKTFGLQPFHLSLFGLDNLSFNLTVGVLLWPVVFVMTDIINEYFGVRGVRLLSWIAAGMIAYSFIMFWIGMHLVPADFWPTSHLHHEMPPEQLNSLKSKVGDLNQAFRLIFGQSSWIIIGSLVAFLVGQIVDVMSFHKIKKYTGERYIWLRATGSTLISQFIDSFVVLFIAFYIGADWTLKAVIAIGIMNYIYKFIVAVVLTPVIYIIHEVIEKYLGEELATKMKNQSLQYK